MMNDEKQVTFYEKKDLMLNSVKQYLPTIVLIASVIAFTFKDIFSFGLAELNPIVLTISMGITYVFTVYVCLAMHRYGKKNAKESTSFKSAVNRLSENKKKISVKGVSYLIPAYCRLKTKQKIDELKRNIIEMATLNYNLYKKGYYKDNNEELTAEQKKAIDEADKLKITPLTAEELLSESQDLKNVADPFKLGKKEKEFDKKSSIKLFISKAIIPLLFSPVSVSIVFSTNILYSIFQTTLILLCSLTYMSNAEEYVLGELRGRYISKADYLEDFLAMLESDMELFKQQEEELKGYLEESEENKKCTTEESNP